MRTMNALIPTIRPTGVPVQVSFSDLPTSDFNELITTIASDEDLQSKICGYNVVGGSFYAPVYPPSSVHLALSFVTLHWMREAPPDAGELLGGNNCLVHEVGVPPESVAAFRRIAMDGLVSFLRLRAKELVPGGEGIFSMTGGGSSDGSCTYLSAFESKRIISKSIARAVSSGSLPKDAMERAFVPLFRFTPRDIETAVGEVEELALGGIVQKTIHMAEGYPNSTLFSLFWSIHKNALKDSIFAKHNEIGEAEREMMMWHLENHAREVVDEHFTECRGARCPYMAFSVTKKTG